MMPNQAEISSVLTVDVKPEKAQAYEGWLAYVKTILEDQEGFLGMEVVRPSESGETVYFLFIRFANKRLLDRWRNSAVFDGIRIASHEFVAKFERAEQQFGTEMFFSRPVSNIHYPKPPFWKQMVIGILTVYPVILIANAVVKPLMKGVNPMLATLLMVCMVSPSMILLMPRVSKLFTSWLYPANS